MAEPEKLSRYGLYPLHDYPGAAALERLGVREGWRDKVRARWNGEKRQPTAGEFYLSGSPIGAYRAGATLSYAYHIAEFVAIEMRPVIGAVTPSAP